jgi:hypothetical protein
MKYTLCMVTFRTRKRKKKRMRLVSKVKPAAVSVSDVWCKRRASRCKHRRGRESEGKYW